MKKLKSKYLAPKIATICLVLRFLCSCATPPPQQGTIPQPQVQVAQNIPGFLKTVFVSTNGLNSNSQRLIEQQLIERGWEVVNAQDADVELTATIHKADWSQPIYQPSGPGVWFNNFIGREEPSPPRAPDMTTFSLIIQAVDAAEPQYIIWKCRFDGREFHANTYDRTFVLARLEKALLQAALKTMPPRTFQPMFPGQAPSPSRSPEASTPPFASSTQ